MNFEVLNQIIEKASQTSLDVVSAQITKSHDVKMAVLLLAIFSIVATVTAFQACEE